MVGGQAPSTSGAKGEGTDSRVRSEWELFDNQFRSLDCLVLVFLPHSSRSWGLSRKCRTRSLDWESRQSCGSWTKKHGDGLNSSGPHLTPLHTGDQALQTWCWKTLLWKLWPIQEERPKSYWVGLSPQKVHTGHLLWSLVSVTSKCVLSSSGGRALSRKPRNTRFLSKVSNAEIETKRSKGRM